VLTHSDMPRTTRQQWTEAAQIRRMAPTAAWQHIAFTHTVLRSHNSEISWTSFTHVWSVVPQPR